MSAALDLVSSGLLLAAGLLAIVASLGVVRLRSPYARFHAAGKASPVAFLLAAFGTALDLGGSGAALAIVAAVAIVVTLPVGVHLLFRSTHRVDAEREALSRPGPSDR